MNRTRDLPACSAVPLSSAPPSASIVRIGVWQLKGVRRNTDIGRCSWCSGEEHVKHVLPDCLETKLG